MLGRFFGVCLAVSAWLLPQGVEASARGAVYPHALTICSVIVNEMTEGRVSMDRAKDMCLAIAAAGNRHFGRVTCGDMWLYMAIVHVESGFKPHVVNEQNCLGLFQVHGPSWASKFGVKYRDLLDPRINAHCGVAIFKYYLEQYRTVVPALSAYNSDDPRAAHGYAWAVLSARKRIGNRYRQLYRVVEERRKAAERSIESSATPQPDPNPKPLTGADRIAEAQLRSLSGPKGSSE